MQSNDILINLVRFIVLVLIQVLLLNNINLGGYINPFLYIYFILLFPLDGNKSLLIFLSFLLGLSIDIFEDSGGVHAAASAFIAYIRPFVLKYSFGVSYEYKSVKIKKADTTEKISVVLKKLLETSLVAGMPYFVSSVIKTFAWRLVLLSKMQKSL